jgi:hypothetical protein
MSDASARERRAAERKRRRDRPEPTEEGSTQLQDALRSAASAAAVGAAVGAAKAMSTRRREDHGASDTADEAREAPGREEPPQAAEPAEPQQPEPQEQEHEQAQEPDPEPVDSGALREIVAQARGLLRELHGSDAESVSSVSRSTAGWNVALEVVELRRIPDSTDVLASYQVELDEDGRLIRYERVRRYNRSQANAGGRDA